MARALDTVTLDGYARDCAAWWIQDRGPLDQAFIKGEFFKLSFKDEFDYLVEAVRANLAGMALGSFGDMIGHLADKDPRHDKAFHKLLADKLAIDPDGAHIAGKIGTTIVGTRSIGMHMIDAETPDSIAFRKREGLDKSHRRLHQKLVPRYLNIYAGEAEERQAGSDVADLLPIGGGALNTRISNECAQLGANAIVDNLDEGAGAAVVQGRTGAQPADPDTAVTGTNLFTLVCSDPAFTAATDGAPGGLKTADPVTDDSSADATGTLGYCRASATADGATPSDDHIDGEAGTSGADFNFNTLSIVSGSTVSLTVWTVTQPEG